MLSRRATDAFEDIATDEIERQSSGYERALDLVGEQSAWLIRAGSDVDDAAAEGRHSPHNPHWRGLSSAALRLIRAHERLEGAPEE